MPSERYYLDNALAANSQVFLKEGEHHHLARVMRTEVGDQIELVNGAGVLAEATVEVIEKSQSRLLITSIQKESKPTEVILIQALPKLPRLELIVEKGTELGMTQLWLFPGQKSEKKELNDHQQQRLEAHMVSAMKQSGRLFLPKLHQLPPLKQWKNRLTFPSFYGDLSLQAPLFKQAWDEKKLKQGVGFFVGPESGWSDNELQLLQMMQVQPVRLHPNILRTETAAIAALALIQHWLME